MAVKKTISLAMLMAFAGEGHVAPDLVETAPVISTKPIVESVKETRRECEPGEPQRCRTVQGTREVIYGYTVVYRYNGRDITTTLPHDPGPTVRVGVSVLDGPPAGRVPAAEAFGSNVREIKRPASAPQEIPPAPAPAPAGNGGGYRYRY